MRDLRGGVHRALGGLLVHLILTLQLLFLGLTDHSIGNALMLLRLFYLLRLLNRHFREMLSLDIRESIRDELVDQGLLLRHNRRGGEYLAAVHVIKSALRKAHGVILPVKESIESLEE